MVKKLHPQPIYGPEDIGTSIDIDNLQSAITSVCHELGLPVDVRKDEMREDGMFSKKIPCLVVSHQNYRRNYFQHVIVQKTMFHSCHITVYLAGNSANLMKMGIGEEAYGQWTTNARIYGLTKGEKGSWLPSLTQIILGQSGKKAARKFNNNEKPYYERVEFAIGLAIAKAGSMPEPAQIPETPPDIGPDRGNRGSGVTPPPAVDPDKGRKVTPPPVVDFDPPEPPAPPVPPKPNASNKIIGIDLGTTNSCVAVWEGGQPNIITSREGFKLTPSVVNFQKDGKRVVGYAAKNGAAASPDRTVSSIKRQMGSAYRFGVDGQWFNPQQISAMILSKLKADAEDYLGMPVDKAVITVPAYFTDVQRQATKDAGEIAGLKVMRIINEPTAAAMAYGLDHDNEQNVMVYDLGGGTFDVSVLKMGDGLTEVVATAGDNRLGGDDFDRCLVDHLLREFRMENGIDLFGDLMAMRRIRDAAEKAKIELSTLNSTVVNLPYLYCDDIRGPMNLSVTVTRSQFNEMIGEYVERTQNIVRQVLADAGLTANQVSKVLLVGGSTRIPAIQEAVRAVMGDKLVKQLNPDECVALGAAVQGAVLSGDATGNLLLDVIPISLGVETHGGAFVKVIEKNTTIPTSFTRVFTTYEENQTSVEIRVFQGEEKDVSDNKFLGCFRLGGIIPAREAVPRIAVTFSVDGNGILQVTAVDQATNRSNSITVTGSSNMSRGEVERAARDAQRYELMHRVG